MALSFNSRGRMLWCCLVRAGIGQQKMRRIGISGSRMRSVRSRTNSLATSTIFAVWHRTVEPTITIIARPKRNTHASNLGPNGVRQLPTLPKSSLSNAVLSATNAIALPCAAQSSHLAVDSKFMGAYCTRQCRINFCIATSQHLSAYCMHTEYGILQLSAWRLLVVMAYSVLCSL